MFSISVYLCNCQYNFQNDKLSCCRISAARAMLREPSSFSRRLIITKICKHKIDVYKNLNFSVSAKKGNPSTLHYMKFIHAYGRVGASGSEPDSNFTIYL
jgi:hypothetical protein